jgi:hypothetical protein
MSLPIYAIGTSAAGMQGLEALGVPLPKAEIVDYAEYVENGEGDLVGQGWLECRWRWASILASQAAIIEGYLGACYISTLTQSGSYVVYSAKMVTQPKRPPKAGQLFDYVAEFRKLVAV